MSLRLAKARPRRGFSTDREALQAAGGGVPPVVRAGGNGNLFTEFLNAYLAELLAYYKRNPLRLLFPVDKRDRQLAAIEPVPRRYFEISGSIGRGSA
jgi:hypothetical protein